jgi:NAD(P) transhydrogenase subunit alpha
VAGLQAIATARRLGASVEAFDVRKAVKEEVESLGAKFVEVEGSAEDQQAGGYAVEQSEEYINRQKELIHQKATKADVIIATANIPGKKAPLLIEEETVRHMQPGSVILDLAAETGGNCAVSENEKEINYHGVTVIGDSRLHITMPKKASRLYANNIYNFLKFVFKDKEKPISFEHEIIRNTYLGDPSKD